MSAANKRYEALLEGSITKSLITLALPIVLANILQTAYQLTDAFWVGRLGGSAVAAVSVSFPVMFLTMAVGMGLAIAGSTLVAQYFGAKNEKMVNHVASQTLLMVTIISVVLGIIGYTLVPTILRAMSVAPDVYAHAIGFMRLSFVGLVFTFGFFIFQSVMRGIGQVTLPMYIVLGTVVLNFGLDPLFIFGTGPFPALGVKGAALATLITQSIATIIGFIILFGGKYGIHLKLADFKPDFSFIKKAFLLGLPASVEQSVRALGFTVTTFIIASFGTLTMAAYGVGSNVLQFVFIPAMGLSMAIATLVGQNIGAGKIDRAAAIAKLGAWFTFSTLTVMGTAIFFAARHIVMFFVPNDPAVIEVGVTFIRIMAFTFGFVGLQMAIIGVFRAAGNMKAAMMMAFVAQWVLQLPLVYVLSKHTALGVNGIWIAYPISNVLTAGVAFLWFMKGAWKNVQLTKQEQFAEKVSEEIIIEEGVH